jgi:hypothetical protein
MGFDFLFCHQSYYKAPQFFLKYFLRWTPDPTRCYCYLNGATHRVCIARQLALQSPMLPKSTYHSHGPVLPSLRRVRRSDFAPSLCPSSSASSGRAVFRGRGGDGLRTRMRKSSVPMVGLPQGCRHTRRARMHRNGRISRSS